MIHVMSDKEIEESNKRIENWWSNLERHLKLHLYQTNKEHFKQMFCVHDFKTSDNSDFEYCNLCDFHKMKE